MSLIPMDYKETSTGEKAVSLGKIVATVGVLDALNRNTQLVEFFIRKHHHGDWGTVDEDAWKMNDQALGKPRPIHSVYFLLDNTSIWIITDGDRSVTTVLLPDEY